MESKFAIADNTGARSAKMIGVLGKRTRQGVVVHATSAIHTASARGEVYDFSIALRHWF